MEMKPLKGRIWIGTHRGNGGEGDLNRRGGDRSTTGHWKEGRAGVRLTLNIPRGVL